MRQLIRKWLAEPTRPDASSPYANRPPLLDYERLKSDFGALSQAYADNRPFPHIVIDNFLPDEVAQALIDQYPIDQAKTQWIEGTYRETQGDGYVQKDKRHLKDVLAMPSIYRELIWELNSKGFLDALTQLTGIRALISDPELLGAGIHQIAHGGLLKIHADFANHRKYSLDRRLNFLLYLNPGWKEEWGGHLELWDAEMHGPPKRVLPVLNRCVIFTTSADSYHGHPHPLTCPQGVYRRSIALYYYTNRPREDELLNGNATHWQDLPEAYRQ